MSAMYANKFTVTLSDTEAIVRFVWLSPEYDENDSVIGTNVVEEKNIVLSRAGFESLRQVMNELSEQKT